MTTDKLALYFVAQQADDAFQAALIKAYGPSKAGDARYRYHHESAEVTTAGAAYRAAMDAYLEAK